MIGMCLTRPMQLSPSAPDLVHLTAPLCGASVTCHRGGERTAQQGWGVFPHGWPWAVGAIDVCYVMLHVFLLCSCSRRSVPTVCRGLLCAGAYSVQGLLWVLQV